MGRNWFLNLLWSAVIGGCAAGLSTVAYAEGVVREIWIVAEEVEWNYAPSYPDNLMTGEEFNDDHNVFVGKRVGVIGRIYTKSVFQEYSRNFGAPLPREEHLGIMGPVIRAEVGDTIVVHFRNNSGFAASIHPHGVRYDKDSEGVPYADGTSGPDKGDDEVAANGGAWVYKWQVPERAGPGPNDPDSIAWPYHSHADETADTNAGLVGTIIIYKSGQLGDDGKPVNLDREFVTLFTVFDENVSNYIGINTDEKVTGDPVSSDDFEESNLMHGINGLLWGNLTGLEMNQGDRVRWYILSMGTEVDLHTPHWHGVTLLNNGNRIDVTEVLPASSKTFDLTADNPGIWMFHCHVNDHLEAGMMTTFTIF